jgi:hypothetical protein
MFIKVEELERAAQRFVEQYQYPPYIIEEDHEQWLDPDWRKYAEECEAELCPIENWHYSSAWACMTSDPQQDEFWGFEEPRNI